MRLLLYGLPLILWDPNFSGDVSMTVIVGRAVSTALRFVPSIAHLTHIEYNLYTSPLVCTASIDDA